MKLVNYGKTTFGGEIKGEIFPRLDLLSLDWTILDIKKYIYAKVKYAYKDGVELKSDQEIN